jgi:hypothetical protein
MSSPCIHHTTRLGAGILVFCGVPFAGAQQMPDLPTLLKDVAAHQRQLDQIRENYTYHRIRQVDDLDKNGAITKTETIEREVFFVNGRQIGRVVKKNGVPISPGEEKAEQERIRKLVEQFAKLPDAAGSGGRVGLIAEILKVVNVSNPRRVVRNGRATLAFDFAGDRHAAAHGMEQNAEKKSAGTVWIDEADRQVARLEVRLDDNFHVGGGLLGSLQKGTRIEVEQSPIGDGLWMETANEQHVEARLVVKRYRQNVHIKDVDFKRFDVESLQKINPPLR